MRRLAHVLFASLVLLASLAGAVIVAGAAAWADDLSRAPRANPDSPAPQAKPDQPKPKTLAEQRAELYARLAVSKDADETEGIVGRLLRSYSEFGSDTGDLLLQRARHAIVVEQYGDALKILDDTVALLPNWAEGWNARATARYLDDDYDGSMADIAQTLKRDPNHLGALMGMAAILEARGENEDALKVYERALAIAPHWRNAEDAAGKLKAALAGEEL